MSGCSLLCKLFASYAYHDSDPGKNQGICVSIKKEYPAREGRITDIKKVIRRELISSQENSRR